MLCPRSILYFGLVTVLLLMSRNVRATSDCRVTQDLPETVVALINEKVFLTCDVSTTGFGDSTDLILDKYYTAGANDESDRTFHEKKITWTCFGSDSDDDKTGYNITIIAGYNNNGTTLYCAISGVCKSKTATLTVVKALPLPPNPPTVQPINTTALNVSWSPPWPHPVNNYTLTISSPDISTQYNTTNDTYFIVSIEIVHVSECSPIVLSVEANTDIGGSGNSNNTTTGFPKSLNDIDIKGNVTWTTNGSDRSLLVHLTRPAVCDYDVLYYEFIVINENTGMNKEYSRQTSSIILLNVESLFSQQAGNDSFTVNVTITNEVNDTKMKTLVENLIIVIPSSTVTHTVTHTSLISSPTSPTTTPSKISSSNNMIMYIVLGVSVFALIIIFILITVTCIICIKKRKKHSIRNTPQLNGGENHIDFILPRMETNPTYSSAINTTYETINNFQDLSSLKKDLTLELPENKEAPPSLPPPRSNDSASNTQPVPERPEDDYVEMNSRSMQSPRYIRAPRTAPPPYDSAIQNGFAYNDSSISPYATQPFPPSHSVNRQHNMAVTDV